MKLDQLQYFVVAAQTQHIGKASRILNVSPSAISHSISNLEEDLGQALFEKSGKSIYLTVAGKRLATKAKKLLLDADTLRAEFRSVNLPLEGLIKVGATHGLSNLIVAPLLAKLQDSHPDLTFEIYSLRSAQVLEMTANGEIDVGFCFSPNPHPSITVQDQVACSLQIAVKPRHPVLKLKEKDRAAAVSGYPLCGPISFAGIDVCENHPALRRFSIQSKTAVASDSYEVSAAFVKHSEAWCLMPDLLIKPLGLESVAINGFAPEAFVTLICPKGRKAPEALLEMIRQR